MCVADVNTPNPDKKSIMMYLMCLFQSLPHEPDVPNDDTAATDAAAEVLFIHTNIHT